MRELKATLKIVVLITALLGVLMMWIASRPPAGRPNVSVTFVGYTNDTGGSRLAMFAISNLSASAVFRAPGYDIQTPKGRMAQSGRFLPKGTQLNAGMSEVVVLPPPTNQSPWKVGVVVYPDIGLARTIKWGVTRALMRVGLPTQYRIKRYAIDSDEVESQKSP